jgi:hypothetical protein
LESIEVAAGDQNQKMMVNLENNPGIAGLQVTLEYDDVVLTIDRVAMEEAFSGLNYMKPANYTSGCTLLFYGAEPDEILDDYAFYIRFDIAEDAPSGTYPVRMILNKVYDVDKNAVDMVIINGSIIVE